MNIELYIEGEKKTFTAPFVPLLARRKYYEIQAKAEQREERPSAQDLLDEDVEMLSILSDVVFQKQFTVDDLYAGQSKEYIDQKLMEAVFGITSKKKEKEDDEGNQTGE